VRSSAIGEDGDAASFAGQHATCLGLRDVAAIAAALRAVHASASAGTALAYRRRLGLDPRPRMAIVVQRVVVADVAGVLFTRNPVTGADERVIEAAWGFGEAVVQGLVAPDLYRLARGGVLLEARPGDKDVCVVLSDDGGTREAPVPADRAARATLDAARLRALEALAARCERAFDGPRDLEWAFADGELWLLQCRAVTR
jgi:pyruvate,water dikinase